MKGTEGQSLNPASSWRERQTASHRWRMEKTASQAGGETERHVPVRASVIEHNEGSKRQFLLDKYVQELEVITEEIARGALESEESSARGVLLDARVKRSHPIAKEIVQSKDKLGLGFAMLGAQGLCAIVADEMLTRDPNNPNPLISNKNIIQTYLVASFILAGLIGLKKISLKQGAIVSSALYSSLVALGAENKISNPISSNEFSPEGIFKLAATVVCAGFCLAGIFGCKKIITSSKQGNTFAARITEERVEGVAQGIKTKGGG